MEDPFVTKYKKVLNDCLNGKYTEELRELYNQPNRDKVPWAAFPAWARPNDETESCHEG